MPGLRQAVCLESRVGGTDGIDIDAELLGEVAHGREPIARRELAVSDQESDPGADLSSDPDVGARIEAER